MAHVKEKKSESKKQPVPHQVTKPSPESHGPVHHQYYYEHDVTELLAWHAPGRPFKYRSREYFVNAALITGAVEVILFLFSQYLLMVVVLSLMFLSFALASVPPRSFYYKISTEGLLMENNFFIWEELYDFYFLTIHGESVLHVRTKAFFPGELVIPLGEVPMEDVKRVLLQYLPFREHVELGMMQKAGDWLERNFPLERNAPKST